jgi:hypothetical protein
VRVDAAKLARTAAAHAMRGKDAAAAKVWDAIQESDRTEKSKGVN